MFVKEKGNIMATHDLKKNIHIVKYFEIRYTDMSNLSLKSSKKITSFKSN